MWAADEATWRDKYAELKADIARHGSLRGLSSRDPALSQWLHHHLNRPGLAADRAAALAQIPGVSADRRPGAGEFVRAVNMWLEQNPGASARDLTTATVVEVGGVLVPIGLRASYYRQRYADGRLDAASRLVIEDLTGWAWELKTARKKRSRG